MKTWELVFEPLQTLTTKRYSPYFLDIEIQIDVSFLYPFKKANLSILNLTQNIKHLYFSKKHMWGELKYRIMKIVKDSPEILKLVGHTKITPDSIKMWKCTVSQLQQIQNQVQTSFYQQYQAQQSKNEQGLSQAVVVSEVSS